MLQNKIIKVQRRIQSPATLTKDLFSAVVSKKTFTLVAKGLF